MQTFLPYESFRDSAQVLDYRRLGKQRLECKQIYLALTDPSYGWKAHPATQMWKGHEYYLLSYAIFITKEWIERGYKDSMLPWFEDKFHDARKSMHLRSYAKPYPAWLGNQEFHASHRSNLLRKAPKHYRQIWPNEPDNLEYVWPSKDLKHLIASQP